MTKVMTKRIIAFLMVMVLSLTMFDFTSFVKRAYAAGGDPSVGEDVTIIANELYDTSYDFTGYSFSGGKTYSTKGYYVNMSMPDGHIAYCIERGKPTLNESYYQASGYPDNDTLIDAVLSYGYCGSTKYGYTAQIERLATQTLIWNITFSDRNWFNANTTSVTGDELTALNAFTSGLGDLAASVRTVYKKIKEKAIDFVNLKTPSFSSSSTARKLTYDSATGKYKLVITDSNGVLSKYDWASAMKNYSYLSTSISDNTLTITSTKAFDALSFTVEYKDSYIDPMYAVVCQPKAGSYYQGCVVHHSKSVPSAYIKIYAEEETGDVKIKKSSDDNKVSGITFTLKQGSKTIGSYTTDSKGEILIEGLSAGTYTVSETVPTGYEPQDDKTVTVKAGETAEVSFSNVTKYGNLKIIKTSDDDKVDGISFTVKKGSTTIGTYVTNSKGEIVIEDLVPGTYTVTETVPSGYEPQSSKTVTVEWNKTAEVKFHNTTKVGNLEIIKTSDDGKVSGITFTVKKGSNTIGTYTTDSQGKILVEDLIPGTYTVTETVPTGYEPQSSQTVTVEWNETAQVKFNNVPKYGWLEIIKTSDDGKVSGITFTVKRDSTLIGTYTTDSQGKILIKNLIPGTYTVIETVPEGYEPQSSQDAMVGWNETAQVKFHNTTKVGNLEIKKTSEDGKVSGITFTVKKDSTVIGTYTTNEEGKILIENLIPGTYTVTETVPEKYENQQSKTVTVEWNKTAEVSFHNILRRGNLKIIKTSDDGEISGISFTVKKDNTTIGTYVTNSKGEILIENLIPGTYTVTEIVPDKYEDQSSKTVTVDWDETATVSFNNIPRKGNLEIVKTSEDGKVSGITFTVKCGTTLIGTYTTDGNGKIRIENLLPGTYTVTETVPTGYEPQSSQTVTVNYDQTSKVSFRNIQKKGDLEIIKTSENNKVSGISFTVKKGDTTIGTYTTDSNGKILIEDLVAGTYTITETVPNEYKPQQPQTVEVVWNETAKVSFYNEQRRGNLKIIKTSEDGKISGITFTVKYGATTIGTYTTNAAGEILIENLLPGSYTITETVPSAYEPQESKTVTVNYDQTATVSFNNILKKGDLKIIKTSEDGKVSGITFTVKKGTTTIGTYTTNANGEIVIKNLVAGTYTVTETVPTGYEPQSSKTVNVVWNETAEVSFHNTLKRGNLTVTKSFIYKNGTSNTNVTSDITSAVISDIKFVLSGTSTTGETVNVTVGLTKSGNDYIAEFKNVPIGTYTLSEKLGSTASRYLVAVADSSVTITYNGNATKSVSNTIETGTLKFGKVVEYGNVNAIQFALKGTSGAGVPVDLTVNVTDKSTKKVVSWMGTINGVKVYDTSEVTVTNGVVEFKNIPVGNYTLTESKCNDFYIPMEAKTNVAIAANQTVDYTGAINGTAVIENKLKRGGLRVYKIAENGEIEGIHFRLQGTSQSGEQVFLDAYTDKNGVAEFKEVPIGSNYILSEVNAPDYFIPFEPVTKVKIDWDKTGNISVPNDKTVYNWDKRGDLILTKTIETSKYPVNNTLQGFEFWLHGTSDSGQTVSLKAKTDANGTITFKDVYIGTYTLEEINTPIRYIVPDAQTVTIHWNGKDNAGEVIDEDEARLPAAAAKFKNELKYFSVEVSKLDAEKGIPQGESTLEGAVYGIYDNGVLVDKYTTDYEGKFVTKEYECGTNWTIKEISPSEGYLIDTTVYSIGSDPKLYTVRHNTAPSITSREQVKKGKFLILKTTGNGTGIYEFEVGAEFEVYLTSKGSYENCQEYERDFLTIEADGTATTKDLPFGTYTIHQVSAWDGSAYADDYELFVGKENGSYSMVPINNGSFESRIRVVKVDGDVADGEEPKVVPLAGAAFQIYDPHGNLVVQTITYPDYMEFDTFYTSENGDFTTPDPLPFGEGYYLVEVEAPYGYIINEEPLYFNVTALDSHWENGYPTIVVEFKDNPQKGTIKVGKLGEVLSSVVNIDSVYQPQFSIEYLQGATYAIIAAEDIYTPDGTLRYAKGTEVDRVTTGEDGTATSKPLYLGHYEVIEIQAPYGMTVDSTPKSVVLSYGDQLVEVTDAVEVAQLNDRQKLALSLFKGMEINTLFGLGMNSEILAVSFGLYAGEDIVAVDGTVIPMGGLIETQFCNENGEIVFESDLPFGKYYVQEISTDVHYVLNGEKFEFTFSYQGQDIDIVEITVNDGRPITNELIYGIVGGVKVDSETADGLMGAVIGLFVNGTTEFTEDEAYMLTTTDANGRFAFKNIPYGVYFVKELIAPTKYVLNDELYRVTIDSDGVEISVTIKDTPIYGNLELTKNDVDYPDNLLSGAEFGVWLDANENGVIDDEDIFVGQMTEADGIYSYNHLKYGVYLIKEITAPEGYILDTGVYSIFIQEDGVTYNVSNNEKDTFSNKHKPEIGTTATVNDGKFTVAEGTITINDTVSYKHLYVGKEYTLVGILMDKTTGQPWLLGGSTVTSSVTFKPETIDGEVEVVFTFNSSLMTETVDLVVFEKLYEGDFEWTSHADISDMGQTVRIYKPELGTTASIDGEKEVNAIGPVVIKDIVEFKHLIVGETYTISGILMDYDTGEALLVDGKVVTSEVEFVAEDKDGFVEVEFTFDMSGFEGVKTVVVFEDLYLGSLKLASHADIEDEGQTVRVLKPSIGTTATVNGVKDEFLIGTITIKDMVSYNNLVVGKEYTITGVLMDKSTGKELIVNGERVTSKVTFVAESENGSIPVIFEFDASGIASNISVVAFESLYYKGIEFDAHADINDADQTVELHKPDIQTVATVGDDKEVHASDKIVLKDTVKYTDLIVGGKYTISGILMNKETNEPFLVNGQTVTASVEFVAETSDGEVVVIFVFDGSGITKNTDLVVFEELYEGERQLAVHTDITDKEQTITVHKPEIGTTATINNEKDTFAVGTITIKDVVKYHDLIIGKEYTVSGILMDQATGKEFLVNGKPVIGETTFIATAEDGEVAVTFTFEAADITNQTSIVVFEDLYFGGKKLASHAEIDDDAQTVVVHKSEIGTAATVNGEKEVFAVGNIVIEDEVAYHDLIVGKKYTITGLLMDKATGKPLTVNGKEITSEITFVAETADGVVTVIFEFDGSAILINTELVVFETLYNQGIEIAVHTDISDKGQTVLVRTPEIGTSATVDGEKETFAIGITTIEDVIKYHNLIIGKEYTVSGILMDKATGKEFLVNGKPVTSETTFVAAANDGEVIVTFVFDGSGITENTDLVVFETIYHGDTEVVTHSNINDVNQTIKVRVPTAGTVATVNSEKEVFAQDTITIVDKVLYEDLIIGKEYTVTGVLMDKSTGKPFIVNGNQITSSVVFTAEDTRGEVLVTFVFDATGINSQTDLVVFETVYYNDVEVASHADIEDEGQTVKLRVPEVGTTATVNDEKEAFVQDAITVVDKVLYADLIAGKEYVVTGILMDKSTGKPFMINDKQVTSSVVFTPENTYGDVTVIFEFDATGITQSTDLVVFEVVSHNGIEIVSHTDINDEGQTIKLRTPEIGTTATVNDEKEVFVQDVITVVDKVFYEDLIAGKEYTVTGVLIDKATNKPFMVNGEEVKTSTIFVAETVDGVVEVVFEIDGTAITQKTELVAFETLKFGEIKLAIHADINDEAQTVLVHTPNIGTSATVSGGSIVDEKEVFGQGEITVTDVVKYNDLITGKEYTLKGVLMDKLTGEVFELDGTAGSAEVKFIAEEADGEVTVIFELNIEEVAENTNLVVFEELYLGDVKITEHCDIEDVGQTVVLRTPSLGTTASINGDKSAFAFGTITLTDVVNYRDLIAGKEYSVTGVLIDKATGSEFIVDEAPVEATATFIPEEPDGSVEVEFVFEASGITESIVVVAFEKLCYNGAELAAHTDIDDADQTVELKKPKVDTHAVLNDALIEELELCVVDDILTYEGLIVGKEYTVKGVLTDKTTGMPYRYYGKTITAEATFVATESNGEVVVQFIFSTRDLGEAFDVVVFEKLFCDGVEIASHEDITASNQTVEIHRIPDDEVPHGDKPSPNPPTGIAFNGWGGVLGLSFIAVFCFNHRKKREKK